MKIILLFSLLYCLSTVSAAQTTYFQQDFSAGGTISNYIDAANPGIGKFTGMGISSPGTTASVVSTITINNNTLETYRPTDVGGATNAPGDPFATYYVDFNPTPASFYIQFTLDGLPLPPASKNADVSAAGLYVGSGGDYANNAGSPANGQTFARLNVNTFNKGTTLEWALRWVNGGSANSPYYTGKHLITWVLNRSGGTLFYLKPPPQTGSPVSETLANGKWDVWVDGTRIFDEIDALTPTASLLNFKYIHANGTGYLRLDDFLFRDVSGVLPVSLTNFRAVVNGAWVDLNWQLPVPDVGSTFVVERSRDGYEYTEISHHRATPDQRYFGITDAEPLAGLSYYRLRHINADGSSALTSPVAVRLDSNLPSFSIRSNPSAAEHISLITSNLPEATYRLTTLTGQAIPCITSETPDGQVTLLPQHRLSSGVYLLTAIAGTVRLTRRVLVH